MTHVSARAITLAVITGSSSTASGDKPRARSCAASELLCGLCVDTHVRTHVRMHVRTHVRMHVRVDARGGVQRRAWICTWMHTRIYRWNHAKASVMHVHVDALWRAHSQHVADHLEGLLQRLRLRVRK